MGIGSRSGPSSRVSAAGSSSLTSEQTGNARPSSSNGRSFHPRAASANTRAAVGDVTARRWTPVTAPFASMQSFTQAIEYARWVRLRARASSASASGRRWTSSVPPARSRASASGPIGGRASRSPCRPANPIQAISGWSRPASWASISKPASSVKTATSGSGLFREPIRRCSVTRQRANASIRSGPIVPGATNRRWQSGPRNHRPPYATDDPSSARMSAAVRADGTSRRSASIVRRCAPVPAPHPTSATAATIAPHRIGRSNLLPRHRGFD